MDKYNLEYKRVVCTAVDWEARPYKFVFLYNGCQYMFKQKRYISQSADTDHIRCAIEQFLEDVEKENDGWISVDERLPNKNVRVLVCLDEESVKCIYTRMDTDRLCGNNWVRWGTAVTHWIPLPEPPKKKVE